MHWGMAAGLAGTLIPLVIHLLNRRRATTVDWGAMQFLELSRQARLKFRMSELILLVGRMALLAGVALALARPFWIGDQPAAAASSETGGFFGGPRRDVVLVIDGSGSMGRKIGRSSSMDQALEWSRQVVSTLRAGDSIAILIARDRVTPLVAPASFDKERAKVALLAQPRTYGTSDLPLALAEALRLADSGGNPARDVYLLTDGQRLAWRPDDHARWSLARDIYEETSRRSGVKPSVRALNFSAPTNGDQGANVSVSEITLSRGLITIDRPFSVATRVSNSGPATISCRAELLVDGEPETASTQDVGPLAPGSEMPLTFGTTIAEPGSHAVTVRLSKLEGGLAEEHESSRAIDVVSALAVLLVDGEPASEPLASETDFLRAALAPGGGNGVPVKTHVLRAEAFDADALNDACVAVIANVARLRPAQFTAVSQFLKNGGGVLFTLGDTVDAPFANALVDSAGENWLPARIGTTKGESALRQVVAHPAPSTFGGRALEALGRGDHPALAGADFFEYRLLEPKDGATVMARLDSGDPWIVERPFGQGRVAMVAGTIDAEGGTLPVNPDFVPMVHELTYHLAAARSMRDSVRPGEPVAVELTSQAPSGVNSVPVTTPSGRKLEAAVVRSPQGKAQARLDLTEEPGVYRFHLPAPEHAAAFAIVQSDQRESDTRLLGDDEKRLVENAFPLRFTSAGSGAAVGAERAVRGGRHEIWRYLVLATLAGLCLEVWLTRRIVKSSGIADLRSDEPTQPLGLEVPGRSSMP